MAEFITSLKAGKCSNTSWLKMMILFVFKCFSNTWFFVFQFRLIPSTVSDNDHILAIPPAVLAELRGSTVRVHSRQSIAGHSRVLRVCRAPVACHIFATEKLLLRWANTNQWLGRRNDSYERWQLLNS